MKIQHIFLCLSFISSASSNYILGSQSKTFADAILECNSINAHVVLPKNLIEDNLIKATYLLHNNVTNGIWLAMYDYPGDETNNNYYTNKSLNFTNWRNGEPGSRNRLCTAYLLKTLLWGDDT
jgi:hypothetical protein